MRPVERCEVPVERVAARPRARVPVRHLELRRVAFLVPPAHVEPARRRRVDEHVRPPQERDVVHAPQIGLLVQVGVEHEEARDVAAPPRVVARQDFGAVDRQRVSPVGAQHAAEVARHHHRVTRCTDDRVRGRALDDRILRLGEQPREVVTALERRVVDVAEERPVGVPLAELVADAAPQLDSEAPFRVRGGGLRGRAALPGVIEPVDLEHLDARIGADDVVAERDGLAVEHDGILAALDRRVARLLAVEELPHLDERVLRAGDGDVILHLERHLRLRGRRRRVDGTRHAPAVVAAAPEVVLRRQAQRGNAATVTAAGQVQVVRDLLRMEVEVVARVSRPLRVSGEDDLIEARPLADLVDQRLELSERRAAERVVLDGDEAVLAVAVAAEQLRRVRDLGGRAEGAVDEHDRRLAGVALRVGDDDVALVDALELAVVAGAGVGAAEGGGGEDGHAEP